MLSAYVQAPAALSVKLPYEPEVEGCGVKLAWPLSTSDTVNEPPVVNVPSSVTDPVPELITAASLVPLIVIVTDEGVPSTLATVKVSVSV